MLQAPDEADDQADEILARLADAIVKIPDAIVDAQRAKAGSDMEEKGQVERVNYFLFKVASPGPGKRQPAAKRNRVYDVVVLPNQLYWCYCGDRKHRGIMCKHIHAALAHMHKEEKEDAAGASFADNSVVESMAAAADAALGCEDGGKGAHAENGAAAAAYAAHLCMSGALRQPGSQGPEAGPEDPLGGGGPADERAVRLAKLNRGECPDCEKQSIIKYGVRHNKNYDNQRYMCKECNRSFSENVGFEKLKAGPDTVTQAIHMWIAGMSLPGVKLWLEEHASITVSIRTILGWAESRIAMVEDYADSALAPQVSSVWRTDEMYYDIRGDEQYVFWIIDNLTRFNLAMQTAEHKGTSDVLPLFRHAAALAAATPAILVSDAADNFHAAWRELYRAKNFMQSPTMHIRHIHNTDCDYNNNLMERFNGWIRARTRSARGLKKIDSALLHGLRIFHNFVRPHGGLGGITPAEAAGISIEGPNRLATLVQNAAVYRRRRARS